MRGKKLFLSLLIALALMLALAVGAGAEPATEPTSQESTVATETATAFDQQAAIDFLEKQAEKHDEFVEKKYTQLLWLVTAVVTVFGSMLGIFGYTGWKDIKKKIDNKVNAQVELQLDNMLEINESLENMKRSAAREKRAREISVLFAASKEASPGEIGEYEILRRSLEMQKYNISAGVEVFSSTDEVQQKIKNYNIIVFYVPENEAKGAKNPPAKLLYECLTKSCDDHRPCILYVPESHLDKSKTNFPYVSIATFHAKLRETVYMLLYFSPLNGN